MDMNTLRAAAREGMKGYCSLCPVCDGRACAGKVPGMGGSITGSSFMENAKALSRVKLNMRTLHDAAEPDTGFTFLGMKLATPIMTGPMTSAAINCGPMSEFDFVDAIVEGAHAAGSLGWIGDPCNAQQYEAALESIRRAGRGVAIIKPRQDLDEIRARFEEALQAGAVALGMDVDGAGLITMKLKGQPVGPKSVAQLKQIRAFVPSVPLIIKGIMTVDDAVRCAEAGMDCIVVSNHGGRVLDGTPGVAEVLPDIAREVKGRMTILADGAVRSGVDALKLLALGADGVLVGRPLCWGAYGGGIEGVATVIKTYTTQLLQAMIMTGCKDLSSIHAGILN